MVLRKGPTFPWETIRGNAAGEAASGLDARHHQGHYGENFVCALAAAAGLQIGRMTPDVTGEDWVLGYPGQRGGMKHNRIEAQVKTWSNPHESATDWKFRGLTETQFNELTGCRLNRFLFLVIVPSDIQRYARATPDALYLRQAAYWASFADRAPIESPSHTKHVPVDVPKDNLLTVKALHWLFGATEVEV